MIGLGTHLAPAWFASARVDPAAAECQRPNCCLKEALPGPAPACSSKRRDAWTLAAPPGSSARPASSGLAVENSDVSPTVGSTETLMVQRRWGLAWGLQPAARPHKRARRRMAPGHRDRPDPGETDGCSGVHVNRVRRGNSAKGTVSSLTLTHLNCESRSKLKA